MYRYAICFEEGFGVKPDKAEAARWFKKAADAGHALAAEWCKKSGGVPDPPKPAAPE